MIQLRSFLVVEDNPTMRKMIARVVDDFANDIFECADGNRALRAYRSYHPDWVLMDIEMGSKDGLSATREICAADPQARVVIVTKYDDAAIRAAAQTAGACAYVLKDNLLALRDLLFLDQSR